MSSVDWTRPTGDEETGSEAGRADQNVRANNNNNKKNNNKVQTKTATPLQHTFFLYLYKGVETNTAAPAFSFEPPLPKTTSQQVLLQVVVVLLLV